MSRPEIGRLPAGAKLALYIDDPIHLDPLEEPMQLDNTHEPVRLNGWAALAVGLALSAAFLWSTGADVRQIVGTLAVMAITSIGGLEFARQQVTPVRNAKLDDGHGDQA